MKFISPIGQRNNLHNYTKKMCTVKPQTNKTKDKTAKIPSTQKIAHQKHSTAIKISLK